MTRSRATLWAIVAAAYLLTIGALCGIGREIHARSFQANTVNASNASEIP